MSLLCTKVSLVSVSSFVVLCTMRWRVSSVSQGLYPVYVSDTVCAFRSSCRLVNRDTILCFLQRPFRSRVSNCIRNCTQKWNLLPQNRINSWEIHHARPLYAKSLFTRCFSPCRLDIFAWKTSSSQSPIGWVLFHHRCCASRRVPRSASSSAKELPTPPVWPSTQRM